MKRAIEPDRVYLSLTDFAKWQRLAETDLCKNFRSVSAPFLIFTDPVTHLVSMNFDTLTSSDSTATGTA